MGKRRAFQAVAAGHASKGGAAIVVPDQGDNGDDAKPDAILKVFDETEFEVYTRLSNSFADDPVREFIPRFDGAYEDVDEDNKPAKFIRIANLLHDFWQPKIMDVKLGNRTFLESECQNTKLRPDLFERINKLYPSELTCEEFGARAITKHRFMSLRDANSTIGNLSYRIDGVAGYRGRSVAELNDELSKYRTTEDTFQAFLEFAEVSATDDGDRVDEVDGRLTIAMGLLGQLKKLARAMEASSFVVGQEFIGSSVLLIADASGRTGVFWIDFAKTHQAPEGVEITHRTRWEMGNHEDGIVMGLYNLVDVWDQIVKLLSTPEGAASVQSLPRYTDTSSRCCTCLPLRRKRGKRCSRSGTETCTWDNDVQLLNALPSFDELKPAQAVAMKAAVAGAAVAAGAVAASAGGAVAIGARKFAITAMKRVSLNGLDLASPAASRGSRTGMESGSTLAESTTMAGMDTTDPPLNSHHSEVKQSSFSPDDRKILSL